MKSLVRRTFIKISSQAGVASLIGAWALPEYLLATPRKNNNTFLNTGKTNLPGKERSSHCLSGIKPCPNNRHVLCR